MNKLRRSLIAVTTACAALAGFSIAPAHAEVITLRFHQQLPAMATVPKYAIVPWINKVEKESGGRIKIKLYNSMTLGGKPPEIYDQVKNGVVDIGWHVLSYNPGRFPKTEVMELPLLTKNALTSSRALQAFVEQNAMDEFKDVKLIAVHTHGPGIFHTRTPVLKMEDLKGMKVRGAGKNVNALISQLGGIPVGMPVPAVAQALSKGVIDGTTIPWEIVPAFKIHQMVKNHTVFADGVSLYTNTFTTVMNKAKYDSLPADLKKVIDNNSGMYAAELFGAAMDRGDAESKAVVIKAGNKIHTLDVAEMQRWKRTASVVEDDWIDAANKAGLDGSGLVKKVRALLSKYD